MSSYTTVLDQIDAGLAKLEQERELLLRARQEVLTNQRKETNGSSR